MSKRKSAETKLCEIVNELGMTQVESILRVIKAYQTIGINQVAIPVINVEEFNTKLNQIKIKTTESK